MKRLRFLEAVGRLDFDSANRITDAELARRADLELALVRLCEDHTLDRWEDDGGRCHASDR